MVTWLHTLPRKRLDLSAAEKVRRWSDPLQVKAFLHNFTNDEL